MNQLNQIILEGNAVKEPTFKEPVPGFGVASFTVVSNHYYRDSKGEMTEEVSYIDIECYNTMAEWVMKEICKGRGIRVVGRLKQSRWQDENDKWCSKLYIIAEHIEFKPKPAAVSEEPKSAEEEPQL